MSRHMLLASVLVFATHAAALADVPTPLGADFQVNSYTAGDQTTPAAAALAGGGFVVVWRSVGSVGDDTDGDSIQARFLGSDGVPTTAQFQVNQYTTSQQVAPAVAADPDEPGEAMVTWVSVGPDGDQAGLSAIRIDSTGSTVGIELVVNAYTTGNQNRPHVAFIEGPTPPRGSSPTDWVASWTSNGQLGEDNAYARRFDADDQALAFDVRVNDDGGPSAALQRSGPAVSTGDGGFWVFFDDFAALTGEGIRATRYGSNGGAIGEVDVGGPGGAEQVDAVLDPEEGFHVVWSDSGEVVGRSVDPAGDPIGGEFQVNVITTGTQFLPSIEATARGGFVVAWTDYGSRVVARTFAGPDQPASDEFVPGTAAGTPAYVDVANPPDDYALFVWKGQPVGAEERGGTRGDGPPGEIIGRIVDLQGRLFADDFESSDVCSWSSATPVPSCPS